ncbi:MAG: hypothetical protein EKK68_04630 [Candidatus Competibacteraceae bacterium]|nr:MAG: hypothetical protein EKK68_04630 [Candidatus Competibacteraceae bacterium]
MTDVCLRPGFSYLPDGWQAK